MGSLAKEPFAVALHSEKASKFVFDMLCTEVQHQSYGYIDRMERRRSLCTSFVCGSYCKTGVGTLTSSSTTET